MRLDRVPVAKTSNLQPYLFRVLQEQDAGAELTIANRGHKRRGDLDGALEKRIVEAFEQLGIDVR